MGQITEESKKHLQLVFTGLQGYIRSLPIEDKYKSDVSKYMGELWKIVKEFGNPESVKADTKESEDYWVAFVRAETDLYNKFGATQRNGQYDWIRYIHWFVIDLLQITARFKE